MTRRVCTGVIDRGIYETPPSRTRDESIAGSMEAWLGPGGGPCRFYYLELSKSGLCNFRWLFARSSVEEC
ncbi:hypothetical protein MTP99_016109 [Tenebrio molitor]|nr:hypothetical protein MTP99_016109 [Tenebrio molitor]